MSYRIVRQPDGGLAVWSTVVDDWVLLDAEQADIIDLLLEYRVSFVTARVGEIVANLDRGDRPYGQFTQTWDELQARRAEIHGEPLDLDAARAAEGIGDGDA